ncbi:MAG TPA: hypothetical protein VKA36_01540 [Solirubrobacterales bacterium]|nr:hypothetical protein [Solirubrobacterales bacterium]
MNKFLTALTLTLAVLVLGSPAIAEAKKIRHRGTLVGVEESRVTLRVTVKKGKVRKVSAFKAVGVQTRCDKGLFGSTFQALNPTKVTRKGNFKEVLKNPDGAKLTISGTVRKRGKRVRGFVKSNRFDGGEATGTCKAPRAKFKTSKA